TLEQTRTAHAAHHVMVAVSGRWTSVWNSFMVWKRRVKPVSEPASARVIPRLQRNTSVPAQYVSLYEYLEHRYATMVVLTFEQIEALLGAALPEPARTEPQW